MSIVDVQITENRYLEHVGHDCSNGAVFQSLLRCGIRRGRTTPLHAQVNFKWRWIMNHFLNNHFNLNEWNFSLGFCLLVGHGLDNLLIILSTSGDQQVNNNQGTARTTSASGFIQKIKRSSKTSEPVAAAGEFPWRKLMRRLIFISTVVTATSLLTKTLVRNEEWSSRKTLFS